MNEKKEKGVSRRQFIKGAGTAVVATGVGASILANGSKFKHDGEENVEGQGFSEESTLDVTLLVNGKTHKLKLQPRTTLLDTLRERLQITGPKRVCDRGTCGACTVLKDGKPVYSCMMLAVDAQNSQVTTVEGFGTEKAMSKVQSAFVEHDGLMCGFCTPGFVTAVHAVLKAKPKATLDEIREGCRGNICRCGTFNRVFEAAVAVAKGEA